MHCHSAPHVMKGGLLRIHHQQSEKCWLLYGLTSKYHLFFIVSRIDRYTLKWNTWDASSWPHPVMFWWKHVASIAGDIIMTEVRGLGYQGWKLRKPWLLCPSHLLLHYNYHFHQYAWLWMVYKTKVHSPKHTKMIIQIEHLGSRTKT
jgi:hypothetical protein